MKAILENKLSMYRTVETHLDENKDIWQAVPAIGTAVGRFKTSIQTINSLSQSLNGGTKGVTAGKHAARDAMADATEEVAGAVGAYAAATGNTELKAKVDFSGSDIRRVRDTESANLCQGIHDAANGVLAALADYGVTADTLTALQEKIDAYSGLVSKPRTARSNNRAAGAMLTAEFEAGDNVLNEQLDGLLTKFKTSQPSFYTAYVAAREIVDNPGGRPAKNGNGNGSNGHDTPAPVVTQ